MPVLGHAFVGLATALWAEPESKHLPSAERRVMIPSLWLPTCVSLAYLPDIVTRFPFFSTLPDARSVTHSLICTFVMSLVISVGLSKLKWFSRGRAFGLVLFSLMTHDVLDILQAEDRQLWWPLSSQRVGFSLLPKDLYRES